MDEDAVYLYGRGERNLQMVSMPYEHTTVRNSRWSSCLPKADNLTTTEIL